MPTVRPRRAGRGWETALAVLAALAAGAAGGYMIALWTATPTPPTGEQTAARPERVTALGRLQPARGVVAIHGPPGDRIAKMFEVAPGKDLAANAPIAELESAKDRAQEVQVAKTQLSESIAARDAAKRAGEQKILAARAELNQTKANKDSDLAAVDARINYLRVAKSTADANLQRLSKLRAGGVKVADEDFEKAQLGTAQAEAELKAAEATRKKTETTYEEGEKAAKAKVEAAEAELAEALARAPIESAKERLQLARQLSERTTLRAPVAGTVLRVSGRDGQATGTEPILQMADLSSMVAIAEVYESDIERLADWVRKGPVKAEVRNPALPRVLNGVVKSEHDIARMIARNQVFPMGPREDVDRRVVEVMIHLDPADAKDAGRFVGLQVTVSMEPNK